MVINSGDHNYSDLAQLIESQGHIVGPITIGNDVWLGAHCVYFAMSRSETVP